MTLCYSLATSFAFIRIDLTECFCSLLDFKLICLQTGVHISEEGQQVQLLQSIRIDTCHSSVKLHASWLFSWFDIQAFFSGLGQSKECCEYITREQTNICGFVHRTLILFNISLINITSPLILSTVNYIRSH